MNGVCYELETNFLKSNERPPIIGGFQFYQLIMLSNSFSSFHLHEIHRAIFSVLLMKYLLLM